MDFSSVKMTLTLVFERKCRGFGNSWFDLSSLKARHSSPVLVSTAVHTACGKQLVLKDHAVSKCSSTEPEPEDQRHAHRALQEEHSGLVGTPASNTPGGGTQGVWWTACVFLDKDVLGFLYKHTHEISRNTIGYFPSHSTIRITPQHLSNHLTQA